VAISVMSTDRGRVGKANVRRLRSWSEHSEWIRAAINIRKTQVAGAEWDIMASDPDGKAIDVGLKNEIRDRIEFANPKSESFQELMEKVVEDILVLDAGSIEIESNLRGEPLYLHDVDGGTVRVNALWDGTNPKEARYFWYPDNFERARWRNDQFIYIMETPRSNSVVGLSKLETLALSIDAELDGHSYNARQVRNAAPDGLLHLGKGAKQENIDKFRAFWQVEQGNGAMAITGGTEIPGFIKFHDSNRDAQFLEWQVYLVRKIAAVMGMDPGDLGIGMDINRSTAEVRDNQTEDRGIRPLMGLLSRHVTREFVWHPEFGGQANNLAFKWTKLNLRESAARAAIYKIALGGMPYMAVNEARKETGREPLGPEFDELAMVSPQGAFSLEDLPTVREYLDQKNAAKAKPPAPAGVSASDLAPLVQEMRDLRLLVSVPRDPQPVQVHIDKGAVDVDVDVHHEPVERPAEPVQVHLVPEAQQFAEMAEGVREAVQTMTAQKQEAPIVNIEAPVVNVEPPQVNVAAAAIDTTSFADALRDLREIIVEQKAVTPKVKPVVRREVMRDENGRIIEIIDHEVE
jgi:hypothetical protein